MYKSPAVLTVLRQRGQSGAERLCVFLRSTPDGFLGDDLISVPLPQSMASLFRTRRLPEDGGSTRKTLGGRRRWMAASPYARRQSTLPLSHVPLPDPSPYARTGKPNWILGLISSAGKMISSVFRSEDSSSYSFASSSDYSSDGDFISCPGAEEDFDASEELPEANQEGEKKGLYCDGMRRKEDIQESESKLTIEHLLMKETFSREECNRLIKMIRSRVADSPSMRYIEENSGRKLSNRDPVSEARKCLEDKIMACNSKHDLVGRPYPLKADMLHQGIEDEVNSPVDLAKSYMQSLRPQHSQSLSSSCILVGQFNGLHQTKGESTPTITTPPSLKVFKRKYPCRKSQDDRQNLLSTSRGAATNAVKLPVQLHGTDKCQNVVLDLGDGRTEDAVKALGIKHENSIQNIISPEATPPEIKIEPISSLGFDEDKLDVIEPLKKTREHNFNVDVCHEHHAFSSTSMVLADSMSDEHRVMASDSIQFRGHSKNNPLRTPSIKAEPETDNYEGPCGHPDVPAIKISAGESRSGTRMRSIEGLLIEPLPGTARGGRKSKRRRRRGRGPK